MASDKSISKSIVKPVNKPELSDHQQELYNKIINDQINIFFTGCAGTGKSFLLKQIIQGFYDKYRDGKYIAITASTGRAAFSIGGTTLHSFAGIGLGVDSAEDLVKRISFNKKTSQRWKQTKVLIVDEISMITGTLLDKLEYIARKIRKDETCFGGIQIILTGDLLQLPPVNNTSEDIKRVFEADCWNKCIKECTSLRSIFRQSDAAFIKVLTCIRFGAVTQEVTEFIDKVSVSREYDSESGPVNLYATKNKTDKYNKSKLDEIDKDLRVYLSEDKIMERSSSSTTLLNNCPAPPELNLKIGAQVMLVKNLTRDLVNGTVGIITGFTKKLDNVESITSTAFKVESLPIVRFTLANNRVYTIPIKREKWETILSGGKVQASRVQVPLILAWAVTIHKSQGQTIQRLKVDLTEVFESGQIYTALSRAISMDTLEVVGFDTDKIKVDQKSIQFYVDNDLI